MRRYFSDRGAVLASIALTIAVFLQEPGKIVPETKLDLVLDPVDFLRRALHLWDTRASFGQIQDQAAGYLFPMGPFYALGHLLRAPMWIVQRAWTSLLIVVALWGVIRVAEALGIGTPGSRLLAAAAYAAGPAMLTGLAQTSGGQLPAVLLPWALLPLVRAHRNGSSPRRAAAASGLACVAMGGINAASFVGVLPLPALWLLTRRRGPARRRLISWWLACVVLGSLWWTISLLMQNRYGLDFRPYTETAGQTTATTSAVEVLRGTGYWLGYLFVHGPWLRAGWELISRPAAILATTSLAAAGLGGLARRDMPERTFLILSASLGMAVFCAGYGGPFGGPLASITRHLLDGSLSSLRNVHKFGPTLGLPVALGIAHSTPLAARWFARSQGPLPVPFVRLASLLAVIVIGVAALPLTDGHLASVGAFRAVPSYWGQTARWLASRSGDARSVLLPAAAFGEYQWGRPLDEPLQALSRTPWAVRDLIPLGSVGETRVLDAVERELDKGQPVAGLADFLGRAGVHYVVLRNDLNRSLTGAPAPAYLRRALSGSPGVSLAVSFGPVVDPGLTTDRINPDLGRSLIEHPAHAVEIYAVQGAGPAAVIYPAQGSMVVSGGPDSLLRLAERGLLGAQAISLAGDPLGTPLSNAGSPATTLTDDLRHREVNFGTVRDNFSYTLTAIEPAPGSSRPPRDRLVVPGISHRSVARMAGAASVEASSYGALARSLPEFQPYNAFDGDPNTAWVSDSLYGSVGQWVQVGLDTPLDPRGMTVQLLADHAWRPRITQLVVSTERGTAVTALADTEAPQSLATPPGSTHWIRLTIDQVRTSGAGNSEAGIRDVAIPGLSIDRTVVLPSDLPPGNPNIVTVDRPTADPYDPVRSNEEDRIDRILQLRQASSYALTASAVPRPGPALDRVFAATGPLQVYASSTWQGIPAFRASNLVDGDVATVWVASPDDSDPQLRLSWTGPRTIDQLVVVPAGGPTLAPTSVRVAGRNGTRTVELTRDGTATFAPIVTDYLLINFPQVSGPGTRLRGLIVPPAIGVAELRIPALAGLRDPQPDLAQAFHLDCGAGPTVEVNGTTVATQVDGHLSDLANLKPLSVHACNNPVQLSAGPNRITSSPGDLLSLTRLTLTSARPSTTASVVTPARPILTSSVAGPEHRSVTLGQGGQSILALDQNFNSGWKATFDGRVLTPTRVDGWRQAWNVPAGSAGTVSILYRPAILYRFGLAAGGLAVLALLMLAFAPMKGRRREVVAVSTSVPLAPARPIADQDRLHRWLAILLAVATIAWLGGILALFVPLLLLVPRAHRLSAPLAAGSFFSAGILIAVSAGAQPGDAAGAFGAPAQFLALLALSAVLTSIVPPYEGNLAKGSRAVA